jgi:hypothetical protein
MPNYRIYRMVDNRVVGIPEYAQRDSDQAITEYAEKMLNGRDIQVLDGPRLVVKLKSTAAKKHTAFPDAGTQSDANNPNDLLAVSQVPDADTSGSSSPLSQTTSIPSLELLAAS